MHLLAGSGCTCSLQPLHLSVKGTRLCGFFKTLHYSTLPLIRDCERNRASVTQPPLHRRQAVMQERDLEEAVASETEAVPLSEFRALLDKSLEVLGYSEDEMVVISDVRLIACTV